MSFGHFQLHLQEPSNGQDLNRGYAFGRGFDRRSPPRSGAQLTRQLQPTRVSSEAFSARSKTGLTVLTAEGDRVTISLAAQVQYAASSQTGPHGSSQTVATSSSSRLDVAVQGDLNETELKDLGTLLSNLTQANSQTGSNASGPTQSTEISPAISDGSAAAAGFAGLTSLAAFAYSYKQTVEAGTLVYSRG